MNNLSPLDYLVRAIDALSVIYRQVGTTHSSPERSDYVDLINFVYARYTPQDIDDAFMRLYLPQQTSK